MADLCCCVRLSDLCCWFTSLHSVCCCFKVWATLSAFAKSVPCLCPCLCARHFVVDAMSWLQSRPCPFWLEATGMESGPALLSVAFAEERRQGHQQRVKDIRAVSGWH